MLKKRLPLTLLLIGLILLPFNSIAKTTIQEIKLPGNLSADLHDLLDIVFLDNNNFLNINVIHEVLDFVATPKISSPLYYAGKKSGAKSAYYEFEIHSDLQSILQYVCNPDIPACMFKPSSVHFSYWLKSEELKQRLIKGWDSLEAQNKPVIVRGIEKVETTPNLFTGSYYRYSLDRAICLFKYNGRKVIISLAKQIDKSDIGKQGYIFGPDKNWNYIYSGQAGLNKPGMGWIRSFVYDLYTISIFYETDPKQPLVKCGIFNWINAGWIGLNMAKEKHIYKGLKRYARDLKAIIENPNLPDINELSEITSEIKNLSIDELRRIIRPYLNSLYRKYNIGEKVTHKNDYMLFNADQYLQHMKRTELQAILVLQYLKGILDKDHSIDTDNTLGKWDG